MIHRVCITGVDGFIGKNLCLLLSESKDLELLPIRRNTSKEDLEEILQKADIVVHLAGVNRPDKESDFMERNYQFTQSIIDTLIQFNRKVPIIFTSSSQAVLDNPYGHSKKKSEEVILKYKIDAGAKIVILRLPGVFGKFCKPNYNSVVATFCHNISRGLEIQINEPDKKIELVYIDDVIEIINKLIRNKDYPIQSNDFIEIPKVYNISLKELADQLYAFANSRTDLTMGNVGNGFTRALYSTYISYLPNSEWSYSIPQYSDQRGVFVEMLKTKESGQFSYLTAPPGVTRGEHYHHSKTEKFLVIKGKALFRFRHMLSDEVYEIRVSGETPTIVDTIPGWAHDITNIGNEEMIVMLWANEIFDRDKPDTYSSKV